MDSEQLDFRGVVSIEFIGDITNDFFIHFCNFFRCKTVDITVFYFFSS